MLLLRLDASRCLKFVIQIMDFERDAIFTPGNRVTKSLLTWLADWVNKYWSLIITRCSVENIKWLVIIQFTLIHISFNTQGKPSENLLTMRYKLTPPWMRGMYSHIVESAHTSSPVSPRANLRYRTTQSQCLLSNATLISLYILAPHCEFVNFITGGQS